MEAIAIIPFLFTVMIPFIMFFVIYAGIIALVIWFIVTFMKTQKERNQILREISAKLDGDTAQMTDTNPTHDKETDNSDKGNEEAPGVTAVNADTVEKEIVTEDGGFTLEREDSSEKTQQDKKESDFS